MRKFRGKRRWFGGLGRMTIWGLGCVGAVVLGLWCTSADADEYKPGIQWSEPKVVDPGPVGGSPSDAIVLFDGRDLSQWAGGDRWIIQDSYAISSGRSISTIQKFGDCQLHLEWAAPEEISGQGQGRGNSGVLIMGRYEVQILDSYENTTYYDGQAGAIYKQHPPLVNACRAPGQWQTYDIIWTAPRFDAQGRLTQPAFVTVLHNGLLIQNHFQLAGDTPYDRGPEYEAHPAKLPIQLQFHGNPVRFRNIWVRELAEVDYTRVAAPRIE
jgi:hypothetical protein